MVAGLALHALLAVATASGVKPADLGLIWPAGWSLGLLAIGVGAVGTVYSLVPKMRHQARLTFLPPAVVTVPLREVRQRVLASGSNFSTVQRVALEKKTVLLAVARARIKNVSNSTFADATDLAASVGIWSGFSTRRVNPIRARWSASKEYWETGDRAAISDRINLPFLGETAIDLAIKYPSQRDAYAYNTDSTVDGLDWRKPEWKLPVGIYTVHVRVLGTPQVRPVEAWFELRNREDALELRLRRRPLLAGLRHRWGNPEGWGTPPEPEAAQRQRSLLASAHVHDVHHDPRRDAENEQIPLAEGEPDPSVCHDCGRSLINDKGTERILLCPKLHGLRPPELRPTLFDGAVECGQLDPNSFGIVHNVAAIGRQITCTCGRQFATKAEFEAHRAAVPQG